MSEPNLHPADQKLIDDVQQYGCQINFVFDNENRKQDFAYSIGFAETVGQPDVIVFGLNKELMHSMLNELYRQMKDGLKLSDGMHVSGLIEGFICVLKRVDPSNIVPEHFGTGMWYYRYKRLPEFSTAYQIVWPGAHSGQFPWEEGCDQEIVDCQPPLYLASMKQ